MNNYNDGFYVAWKINLMRYGVYALAGRAYVLPRALQKSRYEKAYALGF